MADSKYTLGKTAKLLIGAVLANATTFPTRENLMHFCLTNEIKIGIDGTEITFENFCSSGNNVKIPTGDEASLSVGNAQWVLNDDTLLLLENAKRDKTKVAYVYYPAGESAGAGYWGYFNVKKWEVTSPSGGLTTVAHDLNPTGIPDRFGFKGDMATQPGEVGATGPTPLTSGTAVAGITGTQGSVRTYSIAVPDQGDLAVNTSGGTGNADVEIVNAATPGTVLASGNTSTNAETLTLPNLPAGTYLVRLKGTAAYAGVTLTPTITA
jgi:Bacterial pre-peptidase C-terminal domain